MKGLAFRSQSFRSLLDAFVTEKARPGFESLFVQPPIRRFEIGRISRRRFARSNPPGHIPGPTGVGSRCSGPTLRKQLQDLESARAQPRACRATILLSRTRGPERTLAFRPHGSRAHGERGWSTYSEVVSTLHEAYTWIT